MQCEKCGDYEFKLFYQALLDSEYWHVDNTDYLDVKIIYDWLKDWKKENGR